MLDIYLNTKFNNQWIATATVNNRTYRVSSYMGASNKLARLLQREGIEDQPIKIHNPSGSDFMSYSSLYDWGTFNYQEELRKYQLGE